ncbi:ATP-binding cassette domain-containing protein [Tunturibacter psychrotolerans]|uniref:ATP-binding cassette domain-containing protein n=1 Tax=Tunturiibacter psychrotolerans TaxID=3069686 RepID=A0AAU7ZW54_9BACT
MSDSLPEHLLSVKMKHRVGTVSLDVSFALTQPWTVLFGPSGSGKTTVLRAIAGFVRPDAGSIGRGDDLWVDRESGVFVLAHLRPARSAGQTARLFPNMTVRSNAVYGLGWSTKPDDAKKVVEETIGLFRLKDLLDRKPHELSGGEKQRVSVARTVISAVTFDGPGTALLLLDEPFSGLDYAMRDELVGGLREYLILRKIPVLSVTHDVGEAFQLNAEVIRIADGKVVQQGPVSDALKDERRLLMSQLKSGS